MLRLLTVGIACFTGVSLLIMATQCCDMVLQYADLVGSLADGNLQFALDLYKSQGKLDSKSNVVVSPFSVTLALAMTSVGACGQTAVELANTLGFIKGDQNATNQAFSDVLSSLCLGKTGDTTPPPFTLLTANRLYLDQSFPICENFKSDLFKYYLSPITSVDFKGDAEGARNVINSWVEGVTNSKIKDLLAQGILTSDTRLVLANAIYFKANWNRPFNSNLTRKREFYIDGENKIQTDMMIRRAKFSFAQSEELKCKMIALDYVGDRMVMYVILPQERDGLSALEQRLTPENFTSLQKLLTPQMVVVSLPKFKLGIGSDMGDALQKLGIQRVFSLAAELGRISPEGQLYVSKVVHKAFIDVNEEGTEAAAATAVGLNLFSLEIDAEFTADHPFLFVIYCRLTNLILFIGRLSDPTSTQ